jgi:hypothetical protein
MQVQILASKMYFVIKRQYYLKYNFKVVLKSVIN